MTGYGRGVANREGVVAVVEMRSVNHRFLDIKIRGASVAPAVEEGIKTAIRGACGRGVINVGLRVELRAPSAPVRVDMAAAQRVHQQLTELAATLCLTAPVTLELICQQPGVLVAGEPESDDDADAVVAACVAAATDSALRGMLAMRATEGESLAREMTERLERVTAIVEDIAVRAADEPAQAKERLRERLQRLLELHRVALDEGRLAQEVALLADRMDITEELVRLGSHVEHACGLLAQAQSQSLAVGKKLGFLAQEMGREVNTIGAKTQSADITRAVIEAKAELEKLREQVQNIE